MATTIGVYRAHRNGHCVHCGHRYFAAHDTPEVRKGVCSHCTRVGRTMKPDTPGNEPWPPEPERDIPKVLESEPVTFAGHTLTAPGFTSERFEKALCRALIDQLQIKPSVDHPGRYVVGHPGGHAYLTSRERCACKAGSTGVACKHRAFLILHLDIRMPAQQRRWAKLHAERPVREAVASC